jgi:hypothetical protein
VKSIETSPNLKLLKISVDSPNLFDSNGAKINSIGQELRALWQLWEKQPSEEHFSRSKFGAAEHIARQP